MLIIHTGTGLSLLSAKSPLSPPNPSIHSSGDTLLFTFPLITHKSLYVLPLFIPSSFSLPPLFFPSFYLCPSVDTHSERRAVLQVKQDSKTFPCDTHSHTRSHRLNDG